MKVLLVNGSPHPAGCTYTALRAVAGALEENGIGRLKREDAAIRRIVLREEPLIVALPPETVSVPFVTPNVTVMLPLPASMSLIDSPMIARGPRMALALPIWWPVCRVAGN